MRSTTVDTVSLIVAIWCLGPFCQCRYQLSWPSSSITSTTNNNDYLWTGDSFARLRSSTPVATADSGQLGYSWADGRGALYRKQRNGMPLARATSNLEYPMLPAGDPEEPSCEELRTIWHLTKRAARHSLLTNEIPTQATSMFGYFIDSPDRTSAYGLSDGQAFGRIVLEPKANHRRMRPRTGSKPLSTGSFDQVEQQLREGGIFSDAPFHKLGKNVHYQNKNVVTGGYSQPRAFRQSGERFGQNYGLGSFGGARNAYASPILDRDRTMVVGQALGRKYGSADYRGNARLYGIGKDGPSVVYGMYSSPSGLIANDNNDYAKQGKQQASSRGSDHPMRGATYVRQGQHLKSAKIYGNSDAIILSEEPFVSNAGNEIEMQMAVDKLLASSPRKAPALLQGAMHGRTMGGDKPKPGTSINSAKVRIPFSQEVNGCKDAKIKYCQSDKDCACYGLHKCVWGKCKNSSSKSKGPISGTWQDKAITTPKKETDSQTYKTLSEALEASSKFPAHLSNSKSVSQLTTHTRAPKTPQYYLKGMSSIPTRNMPSSSWLPIQLLQKNDEDQLQRVLSSHHRKL